MSNMINQQVGDKLLEKYAKMTRNKNNNLLHVSKRVIK